MIVDMNGRSLYGGQVELFFIEDVLLYNLVDGFWVGRGLLWPDSMSLRMASRSRLFRSSIYVSTMDLLTS